jgi:hypothetical protein
MRIQENIKVEIQHALGHAIPDANEPGFARFYSQLEIEHPELAARLVGSIIEDAPEEPLFPEQLLQAKTRTQARTFMRSAFYRQDPYTGEWHLSKAKVGVGAMLGLCAVLLPMMLTAPGKKPVVATKPPAIEKPAVAKADPAPVVASAPKPQPAPSVEMAPIPAAPVVNSFPPAPEAYPAPAAAPSYEAAPAPAPRYADFSAPARPARAPVVQKPAGSVYKNERPTGGITLYRRGDPQATVRGAELAAASQQAARASGQFTTVGGGRSGSQTSASDAQFATAAAVSQRVPTDGNQPGSTTAFGVGRTSAGSSEDGTLFRRGQGQTPSAGQASGTSEDTTDRLSEESLSPGMIIPASLATGIAIAEGGQAVPVVVRTDTGLTFMGTASLNAARRMQIEFKEVVMGGRSNSITAQAFAPDGLPGLIVDVKDVAPSLVPDLLRASASGVSNYVKSLSEASSTTIVPFGGTTTSRSSTPLGSSIAGALADLFSVPPTQKAIVRIAQVDRGTPLLVTIIVGSQAPKPQ